MQFTVGQHRGSPMGSNSRAPTVIESVKLELFNSGNFKILFHGGVFAAAAYVFAKFGESFAL